MANDSWCTPLYRKNKAPLYGGAARNVRISKSGGMDKIIEKVIRSAFAEANSLASTPTKQGNVIPLKKKTA